ncbi:hypothetical protein QCE62_19740 [Caballeronia sp. LZ033]|uniref:hypothetical protein n=1 Tax=Caballeronia sp. LZ033 TaxID=3038566 RepID=UPI00285FA8C9|nr:hypothetical protein [Caballeronia sp. LZ033]MDR5815823.1 hypothetical protein [Caballeronia sp. LZ033]
MKKKKLVIGLAWYREADYDRLKTVFTDGHALPATYVEWLKKAEKIRNARVSKGDVVVKAYIDPDRFSEWCHIHRKNVDASGRTHFAIAVAADFGRNLKNHQLGIHLGFGG